ncbi:MAG: hypothetical protein JWM68_2871, partial [Verrucomicrobiales bacterium]|nr:hypothetical protein [Verrucomicrobiales bacterium]
APLSGIELQPSGLSPVTTDTNGAYSVAVIPTWTGTITPDTNFTFLPLSRSYTNVSANVTNQNFVIITPEVMKLSTTSTSSDLTFGIFGVSQMKYQAYSSSNLVDWIPYGSVIIGSNSNISLTLPMLSTNQFFQFRLSN